MCCDRLWVLCGETCCADKVFGRHRGVGEGLVTHWEVSETPDVPDWVAGHEHEPGVLGRTAPPRCLDHAGTGPLGAATVRPPYLHPTSRTAAYQPAR